MKINWSDLKARFKEFLQDKERELGTNTNEYNSENSASIFSNAKEFKEYLKNEYNIDTASVSMMDILQKEVQNSQIVTDENEDENEDEKDSVIFDMVNELMQQEDVKTLIDSDSDGELNKDEVSIFLNSMNNFDGDTKNISLDDILAVTDSIKNGTFKLEELEIQGPEAPEILPETQNMGSSSSGYSGSSASGSDIVEKTLDNMTKEELQQELSTAQNELTVNKEAYENIINATDEQSQALKENADNLYQIYQQELKKIDENLAQKLDDAKTAVDNKEQEINQKEIEISNQEITVSNAQNAYDSAVSKRQTLESSLSSLQSESGENEEQKAQISSMISSLKAQIEQAKQAEQQAKTTLENEQNKLKTLESQKTQLDSDLTTLQEQMQNVEEEISSAYPQLKEYQEQYKNAQSEFKQFNTEAKADAKSKLSEAQNYVNEVQKAIANYDNKKLDSEYSLSKAKGTYNVNGVEFATVLPDEFSDIGQFAQLIEQVGMTNLGPWGTKQCFNYSQAYGAFIMNDTNVDFFSENAGYQATKKEWNQRPFKQMTMPTQQYAFNEMKSELDAGRPVVAKIYSSDKSKTHYGLIVGYNKNAGDVLQETDFLVLDSYDANIEQMGTVRHFNGYKTALWFYEQGYSYTGH